MSMSSFVRERAQAYADNTVATLLLAGGSVAVGWSISHFAPLWGLDPRIALALAWVTALLIAVVLSLLLKPKQSRVSGVDRIGARVAEGSIVNAPHFEFKPHIEVKPAFTQSQSQVQVTPEARSEPASPNLTCRTTRVLISHVDLHGRILVEGPQADPYLLDPDTYVIVAQIENEFGMSRKVGDAEGMTAQILYKRPKEGVVLKSNRGAWLSIGNKVTLRVNDTAKLIIAGFPSRDPYLFAFAKEYPMTFDPLDELTAPLSNDFYVVEVRLISEAEGIVFQTLNFNLDVTREPQWDIKLTEIKDLTPLEIRRTVEALLKEASDMLKVFPRMGDVSAEVGKIDEWETRATKFFNQYPDLFSTAFF